MPRRIFPAGTVTNTTGAPLRLTFHITSTSTRRETDLWTVDSSNYLSSQIPNGVILTDSSGAYSAFAGPDDIDVLYVGANGGSRSAITATSTVPSGTAVDRTTFASIAGLDASGAAPQYTSPLPGVRTPAVATTRHVLDSLPDAGTPPWVAVPPATLFAATSAATWPAANLAIYQRFSLTRSRTFRYVNVQVGIQSGNIQVGVSRARPGTGTSAMDFERIIDSGLIACPATGANRIDLGHFTLTPGDYGLFLWCDNTTATFLNGATAGLAASRLTFSATSLASGVLSGVSNVGTTTRWISGLNLEAGNFSVSLLGDSITANDNSAPTGAGSWFSAADQDTGYRFYPLTNNGTAGETSTQIAARAAAAFSGKRYATVLAGTNDVGGSVAAATIISNLQSIYAAAVSAGLTGFAACTIPPRVGASGALTAAQAVILKTVNAWIRANYATYAGAVLIDWAWALSDGTDETTPLTANFSDGVHPNSTGRDIMKVYVKKAIRDWV